jgi:hypothetical protein
MRTPLETHREQTHTQRRTSSDTVEKRCTVEKLCCWVCRSEPARCDWAQRRLWGLTSVSLHACCQERGERGRVPLCMKRPCVALCCVGVVGVGPTEVAAPCCCCCCCCCLLSPLGWQREQQRGAKASSAPKFETHTDKSNKTERRKKGIEEKRTAPLYRPEHGWTGAGNVVLVVCRADLAWQGRWPNCFQFVL